MVVVDNLVNGKRENLADLPVESVIVAHGEPVHDRAAFERALELPPLRLD